MLPRVLVVDDDAVTCDAVRRALFGYDVTTLTSPLDALQRVEAGERFDLVLCDVYMNELHGPDFARRLVRTEAAFRERVLFLTADAEAQGAFLSHPVLAKPFDTQVLRAAVERIAGPGKRVSDAPSGGSSEEPDDARVSQLPTVIPPPKVGND
jgi:CheY-like chemotaxis protein